MQNYKWNDLIKQAKEGEPVYFYWMGTKHSLRKTTWYEDTSGRDRYHICKELDFQLHPHHFCHVEGWIEDMLFVFTYVFNQKCSTSLSISEIKLEHEYEVVE